MGEQYTPGHSANATAFMAARSFGSHGELQEKNGGQTRAGRQLGSWLAAGGMVTKRAQARYECYPDSRVIAEYLALQLEQAGDRDSAVALREWATLPWSLFAQAWVSAIGVKA
jgi:hypothetical protein